LSSPRGGSGAAAREHESYLVGEHDCLDTVAEPQLGENPLHVRLDSRVADGELLRDLAVRVSPLATRTKTSASRGVSSFRPGGGVTGADCANCSISRLVIPGAINASPRATLTAATSSSARVSLSRNPLGPDRSAS
jgi:hypothetical protein